MWMGALMVTQAVLVMVVFYGIRQEVGLLAFLEVVVLRLIFNVELQAISHGLELDWTHDYKDIVFEFDSLSVLKFIKEEVSHTHSYVVIVGYSRPLLTKD
jgi:hypothetical protein